MKVELNPISKNVNELKVGETEGLFSYKTLVAVDTGTGIFKTNEYHSRTTSKHINQWLGAAKAIEVSPEKLECLLYGKD